MSRNQIQIVIEKTADHYSAYAVNVDGVYGAGDTPEKAKQSIEKSIQLLKEYNDQQQVPKILKGNYTIQYKFDVQSLLTYFKKILTNAALERITGINQKQIHHYAKGLKKPKPAQTKKIENALHNLGKEFLAVKL
jgi:predicted RNase H-like HicB family nuclease